MDALIDEIERAFADGVPPPDDRLLHPDCRDDVDILEFFGGPLRSELRDQTIVTHYAALTAFSPEAFQYYLPAFLIWTLNHLDDGEYATESTLVALDPGTEREMLHEFRKSHFDLLTAEQIAAVRHALWHIAEHPDLGEFAESALVNYWIDA